MLYSTLGTCDKSQSTANLSQTNMHLKRVCFIPRTHERLLNTIVSIFEEIKFPVLTSDVLDKKHDNFASPTGPLKSCSLLPSRHSIKTTNYFLTQCKWFINNPRTTLMTQLPTPTAESWRWKKPKLGTFQRYNTFPEFVCIMFAQ